MILVTGTGRCGSSLMMQTLHLLDFPIIGKAWDEDSGLDGDEEDLKQFLDQVVELNPKGYWELPMDEIIARCKTGFIKGAAVKICGALTQEINIDEIEKMIICIRKDRAAQAESMHKLGQLGYKMQGFNKKKQGNFSWFENKTVYDVYHEQEMQGLLIENLKIHYSFPSIEIIFEDILENPEKEIKRLVHFLDIKDIDISKAINNIDKR